VDRRGLLAAAAGVPFVLGVRPAWASLFAGTPLALVTADLESHVVAVELETGRVVREVRTDPGPRSIESVAASSAVIAHTQSGIVSVLDARSLRVRVVLRGFREPRYTAADAGGRYAYVTDSARSDVSCVDVVRGEVLDRLALGGPARHISLSPSGRRLWVALGSKAEEVVVIDVGGRRLRLLARIEPPFLAHDVGFTPDARAAWVTSGDRGQVAIYDVRTRRVHKTLAADAPPQHVTFIGGRAYVTSGDDGTFRVHESRDGRLLGTARVPVGSYNVQQGWGVLLTPSLERGTLCVLGQSGRMFHRLQVARSSHDACFVMAR
jgi:DNA-binding beta-propeller fold protein YncE